MLTKIMALSLSLLNIVFASGAPLAPAGITLKYGGKDVTFYPVQLPSLSLGGSVVSDAASRGIASGILGPDPIKTPQTDNATVGYSFRPGDHPGIPTGRIYVVLAAGIKDGKAFLESQGVNIEEDRGVEDEGHCFITKVKDGVDSVLVAKRLQELREIIIAEPDLCHKAVNCR